MAKVANKGALAAQRMLKKTQMSKYSELKEMIDLLNEKYEFEYVIPGTHFVYDLCLIDRRLLIEFDGTSHDNLTNIHIDREKEFIAEENGFEVVHIEVENNLTIPAEAIFAILDIYDKIMITG